MRAAGPARTVTVACADLDEQGAAIGAIAAADGARSGIHLPGAAPMQVHVPGALPGESVLAEIEHHSPHRAEAWARLVQVVTPSPHRRAPACRAFGACGGCVLQHLDYSEQLRWKAGRVRAIVAAQPALGEVPVADCVAAPRPLGYRNRSKLVCAPTRGAGAGLAPLVLGAYAPRSHDVVDLAGGCRIAEAPLDDVAARLREVLIRLGVTPYDERTATGDLRYAVLRVNHRGAVLAVLVTGRRAWPIGAAVAGALTAAHPAVTGVVQNINPTQGNAIYGPEDLPLAGQPTLDDQIGGVRLRLSARAFLQANRDVAALAYAAIAEALAVQPNDTVVDAYAGVGGIALTLAPRAQAVVGIEENPAAVADAVASAALNQAAQARFQAADAAAGLRGVERADLVVLNPPRKGCAPAVLAEVARLAPRAIAYLSCEPATLARDLVWLAGRGYRARALTPLDMLPHTPHVEVLALVTR